MSSLGTGRLAIWWWAIALLAVHQCITCTAWAGEKWWPQYACRLSVRSAHAEDGRARTYPLEEVVAYSNIASSTGVALVQGFSESAADSGRSVLLADDICPRDGLSGALVTELTFSIVNADVLPATIRPIVCFWLDGEGTGQPGGYIWSGAVPVSLVFDTLTVLPGAWLLTASHAAGLLRLPKGVFWAGAYFELAAPVTGGAAAMPTASVGQIVCDTPTAGASHDKVFISSNAERFAGLDAPAGIITTLGGNPAANTAWEFIVQSSTPARRLSWGQVKTNQTAARGINAHNQGH